MTVTPHNALRAYAGQAPLIFLMNKLVIIDGNAIIHRAYHALPPMTTKEGKMVNAVYGFASILLKVWNELKPTHIAVSFDMAGPTFRHVKFEKYKATRVKADQALYDQIPAVHKLVEAFGLPIYEKQGYEADDVIGTIVNKVNSSQLTVNSDKTDIIIVTGDMDTLQLVNENVRVYTMRKGMSDTIIYDDKAVRDRFGFGPEMVVDYKALRGDTSDNIPGVPGIGEKTASELIQKFGGIDAIYRGIVNNELGIKEKIKAGVLKKLIEGEKSARMSYELATLDNNVPDLDFKLENAELKNFDREKIVKFFQEMEFTSLLKRLPGTEGEGEGSKVKGQSRPTTQSSKKISFSEIKNEKEADDLVRHIKKEKQFACRAITSGADVFTGEFFGLVFATISGNFYVKNKFLEKVAEIFEDKDAELVGHDLKQLVKVLAGRAIEVKNKLFDIMVASYLLHSSSRAHDLKSVILKVLGKELPAGSDQVGLFGADVKLIAAELNLALEAAEKLKNDLKQTSDLGLFEKMEMPLIAILAEMEMNGVAVDLKTLKKLSVEASAEIEKITKEIYKMAGQEFNIASPLQLREILFDKMQIPVEGIKKGKTGLSTSAEQLEKLRGLHPIIDKIGDYRELAKLQNTYIDVLPTLINKKTGRIHTSFNQTATATGRLSSSDPNIQNIPIRTELGREIRKTFVAEEGNLLVSVDYSQIELRIVASLAEDKRMMEIFERGEDIHAATAAAINGVPLEKVTREMRRAAKEINFGILYGMGAYGLSWRAEISQFEARDFIKKYFENFAGVKKYIDRTLEFTKKEGYCETLFGRRRYIPELNADNYQLRAAAERMAINHPVQGTAADLMKMAMIEISKQFSERSTQFKKNEVKMILQVHDELVFEVKNNLADSVAGEVKKIMENVVKLRVPIVAEAHIGKNWGEMK